MRKFVWIGACMTATILILNAAIIAGLGYVIYLLAMHLATLI